MVGHRSSPRNATSSWPRAPDPRAPRARTPGSRRALARKSPAGPAVHADHHVLQDGEAREQGQVLERAADAERRDAVRRECREIGVPVELEPRRGPACRAGDRQLNSVVLPAPLGPMSPTIWPAAIVEGDAVERDDAAEPHREVAHREDRRAAAGAHGLRGPAPPVTGSTRTMTRAVSGVSRIRRGGRTASAETVSSGAGRPSILRRGSRRARARLPSSPGGRGRRGYRRRPG